MQTSPQTIRPAKTPCQHAAHNNERILWPPASPGCSSPAPPIELLSVIDSLAPLAATHLNPYYNQLRQNYINNYVQAQLRKQLPKQFPELSVGKLDVGNTANTLQARNYLKYFQGGSKLVIYYLVNCWNHKSPVGHLSFWRCGRYFAKVLREAGP